MDERSQEFAAYHINRYNRLKGERSNWESHWQDCYDYGLPRHNDVTGFRTRGEKKMARVYDTTACIALDRFATGLYNYMTPPSQRWHIMTPMDPKAADSQVLRRDLMERNDILEQEIRASNFSNECFEAYLDFGAIGMANMMVDRGRETALNFQTRHISEYVCCENSRKRVDTVYCRVPFSPRQAAEEFGTDALSESTSRTLADGKNIDTPEDYIHLMLPRTPYDPYSRLSIDMPYASLWFHVKDKHLVAREGVRRMRYLVARFSKAAREIYGRGPMMQCLADAKELNHHEYLMTMNEEMQIFPPTIMPDDGVASNIDLTPASILWIRPDSVIPQPLRVGGDFQHGMDRAERKRTTIRQTLYNDLFLILQDDKNRTATEVLEVAQDKLNLLGPNFGRCKSELFDPMIELCVDICDSLGLFEPWPAEMGFYQIQYISTLALAMRFSEIKAMSNAMAFLSPFGEMDPSIWDNYSLDDIAQGVGEYMGIPPRWLRSPSAVKEMREARAERQMQLEQVAQATEAAKAIGPLTQRVDPGSIIGMNKDMVAA